MPLGVIGAVAGAGIAAATGGTIATGIALGGLAGSAIASATGGFGGGPSAGGVSGQQSYEQSTVFGEQQGFEQQLAKLIQDPSSVTKLPGYSFNLGQGEEALFRGMNAQGYGGSGNLGGGLVKYGEDYAMSTYNQQVGILSQLAGITAPSSPAQLGGNALAGQQSQNQQMNNLLYQLGILGSGGAFGSAGSPVYSTTNPGGLPPSGYQVPDSAPMFSGGGGTFGPVLS